MKRYEYDIHALGTVRYMNTLSRIDIRCINARADESCGQKIMRVNIVYDNAYCFSDETLTRRAG